MMFVTNKGRVELAACLHIHRPDGDAFLTDPGSFIDRHRLITVQPSGLFGFEDKCEHIGVYGKLNQSTKSDLPKSAYSYRPNPVKGKPPILRRDETWNVNCMEPKSQDWFEYKLGQLQKVPDWADFHFGDSGGRFAFDQGGNSPLRPDVVNTLYRVKDFLGEIAENVTEWEAWDSRPILLNGLSPLTIDLYSTPRVGMIENAFNSNKGVLPTLAQWQNQMAFLGEAQDKGWTPWAFVKLKGPQSVHDVFRNFCVPSIMLADKGSLLYSQSGAEGSPPAYLTGEWKHPLYTPDIGLPLHTEESYEGYAVPAITVGAAMVYVRHYERGCVVVNPNPGVVALNHGPWGDMITMKAQSGLILAGTRSTGIPPLENRHVVGGA